MLVISILVIFVIGYLVIALEHPLRINKAATALSLGTLLWLIWFSAAYFTGGKAGLAEAEYLLFKDFGHAAQILFFLMCAMTIVAIIDANDGFEIITSNIKTTSIRKFVCIVAVCTFFLSAIIDNLVSTIVMLTMVRKVIRDTETRLYFAGLIIIVANSGGAWSPMGNVTSTMLWIGGQVTAAALVKELILPSIFAAITATSVISLKLKGTMPELPKAEECPLKPSPFERNLVFGLGIGSLVMVPIIKTIFQVPPYIAMFFVLGAFWMFIEFLSRRHEPENTPRRLTIYQVIKEVDIPSILFFAGILLAIGVLAASGQLNQLASILESTFGDKRIEMFFIGAISSIIDNVPLVAATMKMYSLNDYETNHFIWQFIAFNCGTGGSMLVIGSAAGIAAMGIDRNLTFGWYMRKIAPVAALSYCIGAGIYLIITGGGVK